MEAKINKSNNGKKNTTVGSQIVNICILGAFGLFLVSTILSEIHPRKLSPVSPSISTPASTATENNAVQLQHQGEKPTVQNSKPALNNRVTSDVAEAKATPIQPNIITETQKVSPKNTSVQTTPDVPTPTVTEKPLTLTTVDNPVPAERNTSPTTRTSTALPVSNLVQTQTPSTTLNHTSTNTIELNSSDFHLGGQLAFQKHTGKLVLRSFTGEIIHFRS